MLGYISYFVSAHPDEWTHEATHFKRIVGYYFAPYLMGLSLIPPSYQWFKYRRIEIHLSDGIIQFNDKIIDIKNVSEIYKKYNANFDSYTYTFYEVVPLEHRKLAIIPMYVVPSSPDVFENELNEFCMENNVKLINSKIQKVSGVQ